jgi:hypothetical protein
MTADATRPAQRRALSSDQDILGETVPQPAAPCFRGRRRAVLRGASEAALE